MEIDGCNLLLFDVIFTPTFLYSGRNDRNSDDNEVASRCTAHTRARTKYWFKCVLTSWSGSSLKERKLVKWKRSNDNNEEAEHW